MQSINTNNMKAFTVYAKSKVTGSDVDYDQTYWVEAETEEKAIEIGKLKCREKNEKFLNCKMITNPYE